MIALPDDQANDWFQRIKAALAAEWAIIGDGHHPRLVRPHAELHWLLADLAAALGVDGGVQTDAGDQKPPRPS